MRVNLRVLVGKTKGKEIAVPVDHFLIGRSDDCHLRPKSDAISRNHCVILTKDDGVVLRDLNSRNGTFVNGERVSGDVDIESGDHVQVGKLEFEILIELPKAKPETKQTLTPAAAKDEDSLDFDITEWLEEGDTGARNRQQAEPETRQFQLDETDRLALAKASEDAENQEAQENGRVKKAPGKLPPRPESQTASSREAAADMLKKFFDGR